MERKKNIRKEFRDKDNVYYKESGSVKNTVEINTWCFRTVIAIVAIIFIVAVG